MGDGLTKASVSVDGLAPREVEGFTPRKVEGLGLGFTAADCVGEGWVDGEAAAVGDGEAVAATAWLAFWFS